MDIIIIILLGIAIFSILISIKYQKKTIECLKIVSDQNKIINSVTQEMKRRDDEKI